MSAVVICLCILLSITLVYLSRKAAPRLPSGIVLGCVLVCGVLLFTQLFNAMFDLPPEALNVSPHDTAVFQVNDTPQASLTTLAHDAALQRLGLWIVLIGLAYGIGRIAVIQRLAQKSWEAFLRIPLRPYVVTMVGLQLALAVGLSVFVFERMPHVQDAIGQLFQARIFADGRLWVEPFRLGGLFSFYTLVESGDRWYSQHPPGFPLLLAPFVRSGLAWLVNPLLGAAATLMIHRLARRFYGEPASRIALLLCLASPFHALMSASFMNHTATLFFLLCAATLLARSREGGRADLLAGFCLGYAVAIRPLTTIAAGAAALLLVLWWTPTVTARVRRAAFIAAGSLLPLGLLALYNWRLNGHALTFGYAIADPLVHRLGFYADSVSYTPLAAVIKTNVLFQALELHLFAWPVASLWFVFLLFLRGRPRAIDFALFGVAAAVAGAYFFYWFQDNCLGPRFMYETLPVWILLSAHGFVGPKREPRRPTAGSVLLLLACLVWTAAVSWPERIERYSDSYWGVDRDLVTVVEENNITDTLVMIGGNGCNPWYYGAGFWANAPGLDGEVIYALYPGAAYVPQVAEAFPGRTLRRWNCENGKLVWP